MLIPIICYGWLLIVSFYIIPLRIRKMTNIPKPPKPPTSRIILEGGGCDFCPVCKSSRVRKYFIFGKKLCINKDCRTNNKPIT